MKASELIKELQKYIDEYGDEIVYVNKPTESLKITRNKVCNLINGYFFIDIRQGDK